ncbi:MAG: hypothetical protein BGN97_03595 [Microbacterium sp. 69-10]|uniref:hypothetical protein n=1 Tax=Microbacterium sp. 69-10 TaxID=1895783 RepID=UPI00095CAAD3|nr:hypothetical protein [Microbacterium sp. 69-10]OJU41799.1 MAG: hypothetical protein BGN97_03595 [Microbacterium sp. 69-10]
MNHAIAELQKRAGFLEGEIEDAQDFARRAAGKATDARLELKRAEEEAEKKRDVLLQLHSEREELLSAIEILRGTDRPDGSGRDD